MKRPAIEIEAKFAVPGLDPIRQRLRTLAARLARPRLRETNLRFDLPDASLQRAGHVLRLRKNHETRLTFKSPRPDVTERRELEIGVDDAETAQQILEALGFGVFFVYEKYRETFLLDGAQVMLDELPFGTFVEVEGDDIGHVQRASARLALAWEERLPLSYTALFENLRRLRAWPFRDATFDNFADVPRLTLDDVRAAAAP
jgi:adenylate cyclase class 2